MKIAVNVVFVLGTFVLSNTAQAQVKDCAYTRFRTGQGQEAETTMTVRAGKTCKIKLGSSLGPISEARILSGPSVGSASALGTTIAYVAKASRTGSDKFRWAWVGQNRFGQDATWPVAVTVNVIP